MKTEVVSEGKIAFGLIADLASGFCGWELERRFRPVIIRSRLKERSKTWVVQAPREWRQVVYHLLGKLCDRRFLPVLNLGFRTWKDSGPMEMAGLLSELDWLKDPALKKKVRYLACHENILNRLAVVDYFDFLLPDPRAFWNCPWEMPIR